MLQATFKLVQPTFKPRSFDFGRNPLALQKTKLEEGSTNFSLLILAGSGVFDKKERLEPTAETDFVGRRTFAPTHPLAI
jgi:hypothetical protein